MRALDIRIAGVVAFGALAAAQAQEAPPAARAAKKTRPNVLFIAVDDLRPELGSYGHPVVKTPQIDRLAARGTAFQRAYCQQAVCNPSRASLMTGRRPETLGVYDLPTHFRDKAPDAVTIAQHFKNHGYITERVGKILHTGHGNRDDSLSWSVQRTHASAPRFGPEGSALIARLEAEAKTQRDQNAGNGARAVGDPSAIRGLPWEAPEVPDEALTDGKIAETAVAILHERALALDRPFFLAVGFANPHLPFVAPKRYWDLYAQKDIRLTAHPLAPRDAPAYAVHDSGELRAYHGIPRAGPLAEAQARKMVHGYWAAVSYMDAQVGKLLDAIDRLGLRDQTIVALWGDHGWQLGEHGMWCKHANYETSARAPLIVSAPGQKARGTRPAALVELVDLVPTLVELGGLPMPKGLDGLSFRPLLDNPRLPWKTAAFNLYPRPIPGVGRGMGRAIRTNRYRLVEWTVAGTDFREYELYDHETDPGENVNLAKSPEQMATVKKLAAQLHAGWRAALPRRLSKS